MNIELGNMKPGQSRPLTDQELAGLHRQIEEHSIKSGEKKE